MSFSLSVDLDAFRASWDDTIEDLTIQADATSEAAADAGIEAEQTNHPYQDRTYNLSGSAHVEIANDGADMVWPAEYASYVNDGTERAKPYPFVPIASDAAEAMLMHKLLTIETT